MQAGTNPFPTTTKVAYGEGHPQEEYMYDGYGAAVEDYYMYEPDTASITDIGQLQPSAPPETIIPWSQAPLKPAARTSSVIAAGGSVFFVVAVLLGLTLVLYKIYKRREVMKNGGRLVRAS